MRDLSAICGARTSRSLAPYRYLAAASRHPGVIERLPKESTDHSKNVKMYVMININTSFII